MVNKITTPGGGGAQNSNNNKKLNEVKITDWKDFPSFMKSYTWFTAILSFNLNIFRTWESTTFLLAKSKEE